MITINVKPALDLDPAAAKVLRSDTGVGLLDAAGEVPDAGMPWPNGGLTLVLLRDGVILRADDPVFATQDEGDAPDPVAADVPKTDASKTGPTVQFPAPAPAAPAAQTSKAPVVQDAPTAK